MGRAHWSRWRDRVGKAKTRRELRPLAQIEEQYRIWVSEGVRMRGKSQKGLAAAMKLSTGTVSKICKGTRPVRLYEVPTIQAYLGTPPPIATNDNHAPAEVADERSVPSGLTVEAVIEPEFWKGAGAVVAISTVPIPGRPDQKFRGIPQYACAIRAQPDAYLICVPYFRVRAQPMHGDKVHVRRTRANGEFEDTQRVVQIVSGKVRLHLPNVAEDTDKPLAYPNNKRSDEAVEIRGLIIGRFEVEPV
jgi:transcriptional regulator with XRE-family HTH domain